MTFVLAAGVPLLVISMCATVLATWAHALTIMDHYRGARDPRRRSPQPQRRLGEPARYADEDRLVGETIEFALLIGRTPKACER